MKHYQFLIANANLRQDTKYDDINQRHFDLYHIISVTFT